MIVYFHFRDVGEDVSDLLAIHQAALPGNQLAQIPTADGRVLVKVAYQNNTPCPEGALALNAAQQHFKKVSLIGN